MLNIQFRKGHLNAGMIEWLGKPLFEMCWFYMGNAQIALDPPALCETGKVPQTILVTTHFKKGLP